jgi:hypothetical protein
VPAAAVIPAPIAYTKVVAVKKLVVGFLCCCDGAVPMVCAFRLQRRILPRTALAFICWGSGTGSFTLRKIECSKQAFALNMLAWNNNIGLWFYFVGIWGPK